VGGRNTCSKGPNSGEQDSTSFKSKSSEETPPRGVRKSNAKKGRCGRLIAFQNLLRLKLFLGEARCGESRDPAGGPRQAILGWFVESISSKNFFTADWQERNQYQRGRAIGLLIRDQWGWKDAEEWGTKEEEGAGKSGAEKVVFYARASLQRVRNQRRESGKKRQNLGGKAQENKEMRGGEPNDVRIFYRDARYWNPCEGVKDGELKLGTKNKRKKGVEASINGKGNAFKIENQVGAQAGDLEQGETLQTKGPGAT